MCGAVMGYVAGLAAFEAGPATMKDFLFKDSQFWKIGRVQLCIWASRHIHIHEDSHVRCQSSGSWSRLRHQG